MRFEFKLEATAVTFDSGDIAREPVRFDAFRKRPACTWLM